MHHRGRREGGLDVFHLLCRSSSRLYFPGPLGGIRRGTFCWVFPPCHPTKIFFQKYLFKLFPETIYFDKMQPAEEKLCLQWNDFSENISSAFGRLRADLDFTDVTLACEDGHQIQAHKFALISSSPLFLELLKNLKHPHPLIYMRGVKSVDLNAILDFVYCGETNVYQKDLDTFLALADEMQLKGLRRIQSDDEFQQFSKKTAQPKNTELHQPKPSQPYKIETFQENIPLAPEASVALMENSCTTDLEDLDQKVKSMMSFSENSTLGAKQERARICNICGKEGYRAFIIQHIEKHHMAGLSIPCNICEKSFCSRNALQTHTSRNHR